MLAVCLALTLVRFGPSADAQQQDRLPVIGQGTAAISGVVTDVVSRRPLAGAIVTLTPVSGARTGLPARQVTDATGRFLFTDLEEGDGYRLGATRFGYIGSNGIDQGGPARPGRSIVLAAGEWLANVSIALARPNAISGVITDESGEPVVGAYVRALAEINFAGQTRTIAGPVTRSDDRGIYRLSGLSPGRYVVSVPSVQMSVPAGTSLLALSSLTPTAVANAEAAGRPVTYRRDPAVRGDGAAHLLVGSFVTPPPGDAGTPSRVYPPIFYPAARTLAGATRIELGAGEDRLGIDLRLLPERAVRISGRVEAPPDALVNLTLRLLVAGDEHLTSGNETGTAMVAPDGTFTFLNVPAGRYSIDAAPPPTQLAPTSAATTGLTNLPIPPGLARSFTTFIAPGTGAGLYGPRSLAPLYSARERVDVGQTDLTDVVVRLDRGVTLRGTLVIEQTRAGAAPSRPAVVAESLDGDPRGRVVPVNPGGDAFAIEGLLAGEYVVRVTNGIIKSVTWGGTDYTYRPFPITPGRDIDGVVVTTTDQEARVSGSVRDASGVVATQNAVLVFPAEPAQWRRYGTQPSRIRWVPISSDGRFTIDRLPAGDYLLIALDREAAGRWSDPAFLERAAVQAARATVAWGETRTQDLILQQVR